MTKSTISLSRRLVYAWAREVLSHLARGQYPKGDELSLLLHLHRRLSAAEWHKVGVHPNAMTTRGLEQFNARYARRK